MVKGEQGRTCEVPIPSGCTVANFPGYDDPWIDVSKGGKTSCAIDEEKTDWKTKIVAPVVRAARIIVRPGSA